MAYLSFSELAFHFPIEHVQWFFFFIPLLALFNVNFSHLLTHTYVHIHTNIVLLWNSLHFLGDAILTIISCIYFQLNIFFENSIKILFFRVIERHTMWGLNYFTDVSASSITDSYSQKFYTEIGTTIKLPCWDSETFLHRHSFKHYIADRRDCIP